LDASAPARGPHPEARHHCTSRNHAHDTHARDGARANDLIAAAVVAARGGERSRRWRRRVAACTAICKGVMRSSKRQSQSQTFEVEVRGMCLAHTADLAHFTGEGRTAGRRQRQRVQPPTELGCWNGANLQTAPAVGRSSHHSHRCTSAEGSKRWRSSSSCACSQR